MAADARHNCQKVNEMKNVKVSVLQIAQKCMITCKQRLMSDPASRSRAGSDWLACGDAGSVESVGEQPRRAGDESADCCAVKPAVLCGVNGGEGSEVTEASVSLSRLRSARLHWR